MYFSSYIHRQMGVLAMCGVSSVDVFRAPKVAVLSTGDEIIEPFTQAGAMRPGQVRDANRIMLVSMCARVLNVSVDNIVDLGIVVDDRERLLRRVRGMLEDDGIDVAICSGGKDQSHLFSIDTVRAISLSLTHTLIRTRTHALGSLHD